MINMDKLLGKMEAKKFTKLANEEDVVLFTRENILIYIYDKKNKKRYYPKTTLIVER
jgi:hypothetical protein